MGVPKPRRERGEARRLLPTGSEAVAPAMLVDEMVDQALYGVAGRR